MYVNIQHSQVGDLDIELKHVDSGTTTTLLNQPLSGACSGNDMNLIISELDTNAPDLETNCQSTRAYPQLSNKFKPMAGSLNAFMGGPINGTWEIKVIDNASGSNGTLQQWCLYPELDFIDLIFENGFD